MCRNEVQQVKMNSQADQPHAQSAQGLRQSLERELQQQVTQLEVSTHVWKFRLFLLNHCVSANTALESEVPAGFLGAETKCDEPRTQAPMPQRLMLCSHSLCAIDAKCKCLDGKLTCTGS